MTKNVSDIVVLARTIGMAGVSSTKDDQPASDNADARNANASRFGAGESHYALATRLGLPGFEPATGTSR